MIKKSFSSFLLPIGFGCVKIMRNKKNGQIQYSLCCTPKSTLCLFIISYVFLFPCPYSGMYELTEHRSRQMLPQFLTSTDSPQSMAFNSYGFFSSAPGWGWESSVLVWLYPSASQLEKGKWQDPLLPADQELLQWWPPIHPAWTVVGCLSMACPPPSFTGQQWTLTSFLPVPNRAAESQRE